MASHGPPARDSPAQAAQDYCFKDNVQGRDVANDFDAAERENPKWFHVPWQHHGPSGREGVHGLTKEAPVQPQQLALSQTYSGGQMYAVGLYNEFGGYTIGKVWADKEHPNPKNIRFPVGTVVMKAARKWQTVINTIKSRMWTRKRSFASGVLRNSPVSDANLGEKGASTRQTEARNGKRAVSAWLAALRFAPCETPTLKDAGLAADLCSARRGSGASSVTAAGRFSALFREAKNRINRGKQEWRRSESAHNAGQSPTELQNHACFFSVSEAVYRRTEKRFVVKNQKRFGCKSERHGHRNFVGWLLETGSISSQRTNRCPS